MVLWHVLCIRKQRWNTISMTDKMYSRYWLWVVHHGQSLLSVIVLNDINYKPHRVPVWLASSENAGHGAPVEQVQKTSEPAASRKRESTGGDVDGPSRKKTASGIYLWLMNDWWSIDWILQQFGCITVTIFRLFCQKCLFLPGHLGAITGHI